MPPPAGEFERLLRDPIHPAPGEEVQLPTRVFAERQGAAWAQVEVPARLPGYRPARVAEAPHPSRAQVRVEVLTGERGKPGATVHEPADDGALSVGVVVLDRGRDQSGGGAWIRVVAVGSLHNPPAVIQTALARRLYVDLFPRPLPHVPDVQEACRAIECKSPRVPQTQRPVLRRPATIPERFARWDHVRCAAVSADRQQMTEDQVAAL